MGMEKICEKAEKIAKIYNPEGISPFPFDKIVEKKDNLNIYYTKFLPDNVSGAIVYEKDGDNYSIYINKNNNPNRQHFTAAHEVGHFFLHKDIIKAEETIIDTEGEGGNPILYRLDSGILTKIEKEANNFAASLIMPSKLVIEAWEALESVEECAKIFNVSVSAMSIRLERLKLIN